MFRLHRVQSMRKTKESSIWQRKSRSRKLPTVLVVTATTMPYLWSKLT